MVVAHRGFRALAPENTLASAGKAAEAGATWWELDVAASSDGTLVVLHDDTLVRTTDAKAVYPDRKPWSVYDFSYEELSRLDAGSWFEAADPFREIASGRVGRADLDAYKSTRLPTLKEALEFTKAHGMKLYVEIKDATGRACDPWIAERTVEIIRDEGMLDSVIVQSFNLDYARRAKLAEPRLRTAALFEKRLEAGELVAILKAIGASSWNPKMQILDEATLKAVRAAGFDSAVWTVNDPRDMRRLLDWGATGIITDYPDRALSLLD
jgi:glycerophosphoryl diester phosphodiesterase